MPVFNDYQVEPDHLSLAIDRILASRVFERTHRLSELLRYLMEHTRKGDLQALKEAVIGQKVFGRPCDYNAADDNIVRSNIRQLRLKIEEYYKTEGAGDPWRLSIPKGAYTLILAETAVPKLPARDAKRLPFSFKALFVAIPALAVVLALVVHKPASSRVHTLLALLAPAPGQHVLVVGPDAAVQLYRRLTKRSVSLESYIKGTYVRPNELDQALPGLGSKANELFESPATEAFVLNLIPGFAQIIPPNSLSAPAPGSLSVKNFTRDHVVLISGPLGNPWVQLFDSDLNFQIESEADGAHSYITNHSPARSERRFYSNFADSSGATVCYARLAYLPGSPGTKVILAGGPHKASTQAAALFLTRPDLFETLRRALGKENDGSFPWFEAVIEARALDNEPWTFRIVASRLIPSPRPAVLQ